MTDLRSQQLRAVITVIAPGIDDPAELFPAVSRKVEICRGDHVLESEVFDLRTNAYEWAFQRLRHHGADHG